MKGLIILLLFILSIALGVRSYADSTQIDVATNPAPAPRLIDPDVQPMSLIVDPVPDYDKNNLARAIDWTVDHADCLNGWSLTGWSKTTLDENYNVSSIKLGFISGRMDYQHYLTHNFENDLPQERNRPRPAIFGIFFSKEF